MISDPVHAAMGFGVGGEEPVAPEDPDVGRLIEEVRLVRDHDAHEPVAILKRHQPSGAGLVPRRFLELQEEIGVLERSGEETVAF